MKSYIPACMASCLLLTGCFGSNSGLWLITVQAANIANYVCSDTAISHNFTDAEVPGEDSVDGPYTIEEETSRSGSLVFANFDLSDKDNAVMVVGDTVYVGTKTESGEWLFTWTDETKVQRSEAYQQAYSYDANLTQQVVSTFTVTFDGDSLTGTSSVTDYSISVYSETDEWPNEVAKVVGDNGSIPADEYLIIPRGKGGGSPAVNENREADCDDALCRLTVEDNCSLTVDVTGFQTGYESDEIWDGVQYDQAPGR